MTEDRPFQSSVKVVCRSYGVSNDPAVAGTTYAVASHAPTDARILMLEDPRLITSGAATFLVGVPETKYYTVSYDLNPDTDMDTQTNRGAEVWINTADIIALIEER